MYVFSAEGEKVSGAGMGVNVAGLAYHASNEDDPYITLKDVVSCILINTIYREYYITVFHKNNA